MTEEKKVGLSSSNERPSGSRKGFFVGEEILRRFNDKMRACISEENGSCLGAGSAKRHLETFETFSLIFEVEMEWA